MKSIYEPVEEPESVKQEDFIVGNDCGDEHEDPIVVAENFE